MLEYVFFQEEPRQQFLAFLASRGVAWGLETREPEIVVVIDDSTLDEELLERLESRYDELFDLEQSLFEKRRGRAAGLRTLTINLSQGQAVRAELPSELLDRVLTVLTPEELSTLAGAIARAMKAR